MPRELGWRSFSPNQIRLTSFALGCVWSAQPLLEHYVALIRLALERYEDVAEPATVSRELAVSRLGLDARDADMLSQLVMDDHPFFGSSVSSADSSEWEFSVEDRILQFDDVKTVDELLVLLAGWRLSPPPANPFIAPAPVVAGQLGVSDGADPSVGDAAVAAATLVGFAVLVISGLAP